MNYDDLINEFNYLDEKQLVYILALVKDLNNKR